MNHSSIQFTEHDLPNGLHIILSPSKLQPIVSVNLWYHVGSKDEDPRRTGFAHLFEHLMFEGSANVKKTEHFKYIQSAGGVLNATTSFDRTNYFETLPSNQLELALWLESDRMSSLDVSEKNFENQRSVVKEERRQRYDNKPYGRTFETVLHHLYSESGYHWSTIGSMQHLDETSIEEVQAFHNAWYAPNNASLAISGDFNPDTALSLIEKYFGDIPRKKLSPRPEQKIIPITKPISLKTEDAVSLPSVFIAFQSAAAYSKNDYAMEILADTLSRGKSSRLYKSLVYEKQLAKSISVYNYALEKTGIFMIDSIAQRGITPEVLEEAIRTELNNFFAEGITADELEKAKNRNLMRRSQHLQQLAYKNDSLQQAYTFCRDTEMANKELDMLLAVQREDVNALSDFLKREKSVTLYTVPRS